MELQFHKSVLSFLQPLLRETQTQELTQEVRLPESMPDIGKVIAAWGQALVRGKEWRSGSIGASGGVMVWVLYAPEDGSEANCIEAWLPFQSKWEIPDADRDGSICVMPMLRGVDARSVSARKLMVRAGLAITAEAYVPAEATLYEADELPEDVCVLKTRYPVMLPREAGEKTFSVEERIQLPADSPPLEKLLRYSLQPVLTEQKVMADKLIFRGNACLTILYRGVGGQIHKGEFEVPFAQYAELDREYDSTACARVQVVVTNLELEQAEENALGLKAGMSAQYVICERPAIELVEDAYSPRRKVVPVLEQLDIPAVLEEKTETVTADVTADTTLSRLVDGEFYPDQPLLYREEDTINAELTGQYQLLGHDADGQLRAESGKWQDNRSVPADSDSRLLMSVTPLGKPRASVNSGAAELSSQMQLQWQTMARKGIPMVSALEIGEEKESDANRPSLILRRAGTDRLWDIAKETGTTVEEIRKINALEQEPDSNQMLLIPVH